MGQGQSAKLPKGDMDFLLKNTTFTKSTIKQWYEAFMIDCPSGQLTKEKLTELYGTLYQNGNADSFCRHTFRTFDTDNSGFIDFREFLLAVSIVSTGTPTEKLEWAFAMADIDGNGTIEREEIKIIVRAAIKMTQDDDDELAADQKANEIFERLDLNKDGVLSKDEFVQGCLRDPSLSEILAPTPDFDGFD